MRGPGNNGLLCRYAEALGLEVQQMFRASVVRTDDQDVGDDVAHVIAVIVAAGGVVQIDQMAEALEWSPKRVRVALDDAAVLLPGIGLRLVWFGDTAVELLADARMVAPVPELSARSVQTFGFNRDAGRLVWQLIAKTKLSRASNPVVERHLVDAGVVEYATAALPSSTGPKYGTRSALRLTAETRFNLCLDIS